MYRIRIFKNRVADPPPDPPVARAIERLLDAERAAQAAVKDCERASAERLADARQQARGILERAQARTVALHGRAAKTLERCASEIMEQRMKSAAATVKELSDPKRLDAAIERLAARLTTDAAPQDAA